MRNGSEDGSSPPTKQGESLLGRGRWALSRIGQIVKQEGWRSLWFRGLAMLGYQRTGYLMCPLETPLLAELPTVPVDVSLLRPTDAKEYVAFRRGACEEDFHDRLGWGFVCYAARCEGRIASVTWVATGRAILWLLDAEFEVGPDQVYLFDSFTAPDFRGKRVQSAVFVRLRDDALNAGRRRAVTFVIPENRPNMRSRGRMGFSLAGVVGRVKIGPLRWYFSRGNAPTMRRRRA